MTMQLIYISDGFPFAKKDVFSKDDLEFLSKENWNLHVLPRLRKISTSNIKCEFPYIVDTSLVIPLWKRMLALLQPSAISLLCKEIAINIRNSRKIHTISLLNAVGVALYSYGALKKYIEKNKLQNEQVIIYSFWFSPILIGASLLRQHFPQIRIVSRLHGVDLYAHRHNSNYLPFQFWRKDALDILAPCSERGCEYLRAEGVPEEKIVRAYLGVPETKGFASVGPADALHLVSCCFIQPVKRMPLLAKSLIEFARAYPKQKIVWHHLGGGSGLQELQSIMEQSVHNLSAIFHGNMCTADVRNFFLGKTTDGLDGLICVSESEGLPVSMMEAQMAGLPIVSTNVGGISEIVNEETGTFIPKDFDQDQFNEAILSIAHWKNAQSRYEIAEHTRTKFSMQNYQKFIDKVLWKQFQ